MKKYSNGELQARQSFDGTWFVERFSGKRSCITVKAKLTEDQAKAIILGA